ncbi:MULTISPECIES: type II toxin-antitoxin system PrlF family antitoxin [Gammaproteobacteria]|uniref:AbrB/MazE/SpoVT family DNA-binding domain-containing protein n=1 Tax=Gammaproteobacteria TaxID=1236 RepID=UPI001ADCD007|nr:MULTISPECIES: type II toxin-antitoxin system PrlF family antitoxin [Gammaproteobacteria]MBO9480816.1 type II toxin-antitoxin system PrlF family antitoxin [Salinisphaera sp. G21_0]MBO9495257.1 type II toxin-antitoxin system PrlF family antitoxin [Thalassotalea sp. G20_0]
MMKLTTQGQVTIPANIRKSLGLKPGDRVSFLENDRGEIVVQKVDVEYSDPVEKAADDFSLTMGADELMKLLRDDH